MMLALLLLALLPQQRIDFRAPPAQPYTLRAMVPGMRPPLSVAGAPSDSRLVLELEDGTPVTEVVARVPGGTASASIVQGAGPSGPSLVADLLSWVARPGRVVLRIDGQPFPLSNPAHFVRWFRSGNVMATAEMHRDLGQYGHAEWWITARDRQLDFALVWHRAIPGPGVRFTEARIQVAGASWRETLPDPAGDPPFLVAPVSGGHVIPQQCARVFRFSIRPDGGPIEPERVGTADWSAGGFLPAGLPVPDAPQPAASQWFAAELVGARARLANLLPWPSWAAHPVSPLWPAQGEQFSGSAATTERSPLTGALWAGSGGDPNALEKAYIDLLRYASRARIRLGPDGQPLDLQGLARTWSFDNVFLGGDDSPWYWDSYWNPWEGARDPRNFQDYALALLQVRLANCWALVWLANDPVAGLFTREGATRALLTHGPLTLPATCGIGTDVGSPHAIGMLAIAAARALGETQYEPVIAAYKAHLACAQMPSGCLVARGYTYPYQLWPFTPYPHVRLQGIAEFSYHMLALYALGDRDVVRRCAHGLASIQTDNEPGDVGGYYFAPTGMGSTARYLTRFEWPAALRPEMGKSGGNMSYYTWFDTAYAFAVAWEVNAPERFDLLERTFGTADPVAVRAIIRSWGLQAPSEFTSAPYEQFAPLSGVLR